MEATVYGQNLDQSRKALAKGPLRFKLMGETINQLFVENCASGRETVVNLVGTDFSLWRDYNLTQEAGRFLVGEKQGALESPGKGASLISRRQRCIGKASWKNMNYPDEERQKKVPSLGNRGNSTANDRF